MIKRIKKIKGVGQFYDCGHSSLEKVTLIYGPNCYGKSTFTDIFRSLQFDNVDILKKRKSIGLLEQSKIEFTYVTDEETTEKIIKFDQCWNKERFPYEIWIFDTKFIEDNIFTGSIITRENKENLTNLLMGEASVKIAGKIESVKRRKREVTIKYQEIAKNLKMKLGLSNLGITIEKFLDYDIDESIDIDEVNKDIEDNREKIKKLKTLLEKNNSILQIDNLIPINYDLVVKQDFLQIGVDIEGLWQDLIKNGYIDEGGLILNKFKALDKYSGLILNPLYGDKKEQIFNILQQCCYLDYISKLIRNFREIFERSFDELNKEVIFIIRRHIEKHFEIKDGEEESWIRKGLCYKNNFCPFCGQGLDGARNLIDAYRRYFSEAYERFYKEIEDSLKLNNRRMENIISKFSNLIKQVRLNIITIQKYQTFLDDEDQKEIEQFVSLSETLIQLLENFKETLLRLDSLIKNKNEEKKTI